MVKLKHNSDYLARSPVVIFRSCPGARFSKVPNLFGRISGDLILFVSSKRRRLEARNFSIVLIFIPFTTYEKTSRFRNGFTCPKLKSSGLWRNGAPVAKSARTIHLQPAKKKQNSPLCPVSVSFFVNINLVGYILKELKASFC